MIQLTPLQILARTCSKYRDKGLSHQIDYSWTLNCKKCHESCCFAHNLKANRLHSSEALLSNQADDTHQRYHEGHKNSRSIYDSHCVNGENGERNGNSDNLFCILARNALLYKHCSLRPLNPRFLEAGWYDRPFQTSLVPLILFIILCTSNDCFQETQEKNSSSGSSSSKPRASAIDTPATIPHKLNGSDFQVVRKRRNMVYVAVPSAPYRIHRSAAQTRFSLPSNIDSPREKDLVTQEMNGSTPASRQYKRRRVKVRAAASALAEGSAMETSKNSEKHVQEGSVSRNVAPVGRSLLQDHTAPHRSVQDQPDFKTSSVPINDKKRVLAKLRFKKMRLPDSDQGCTTSTILFDRSENTEGEASGSHSRSMDIGDNPGQLTLPMATSHSSNSLQKTGSPLSLSQSEASNPFRSDIAHKVWDLVVSSLINSLYGSTLTFVA